MRLDLKPDITLAELAALVTAMTNLRHAQLLLAARRYLGKTNPVMGEMRFWEATVCQRLDELWEAQQVALRPPLAFIYEVPPCAFVAPPGHFKRSQDRAYDPTVSDGY